MAIVQFIVLLRVRTINFLIGPHFMLNGPLIYKGEHRQYQDFFTIILFEAVNKPPSYNLGREFNIVKSTAAFAANLM